MPERYEFHFELSRKTTKHFSLKSGNQVIGSNDPINFRVKMLVVSYLRNLATETAQQQYPELSTDNPVFTPEHKCKIEIVLDQPTRRRTDAPNFYPTVKALIDRMTDAGMWSDDNNKVIESMTFKRREINPNKCYQFNITITEA